MILDYSDIFPAAAGVRHDNLFHIRAQAVHLERKQQADQLSCQLRRHHPSNEIPGDQNRQIFIDMSHLDLVRYKLLHPGTHGRKDLRDAVLRVGHVAIDMGLAAPVHGFVHHEITADHLRHLLDPDLTHGLHIVFIQPGDLQIARNRCLVQREILFFRLPAVDCHLSLHGEYIIKTRIGVASVKNTERNGIISPLAADQIHAVKHKPLIQHVLLHRPSKQHPRTARPFMEKERILPYNHDPFQH